MADGGDEYTQADDILRLLVQRVGRAFYEKEHVVVLDMLLNYRGMSAEALSQKLEMPIKQLQKNLHKLEKDHLLAWELTDQRDGKLGMKTKIYFINYKRFVDSVRFKILHMRARLQSMAKNVDAELFYYKCPGWCRRQFSLVDALGMKRQVYTGEGFEFVCDKCEVQLEEVDNSAAPKSGQSQQKLIEQLKPFIDMLQKTEELIIPSYTGSPGDDVMEIREYEEAKLQDGSNGGRGGFGGSRSGGGGRKNQGREWFKEKEIDIIIQADEKDRPKTDSSNKGKNTMPVWIQQSTVDSLKRKYEDDNGTDYMVTDVVDNDEMDDSEDPMVIAPLAEQQPSADYVQTYYQELMARQKAGVLDDDDNDDDFEEFAPVPVKTPFAVDRTSSLGATAAANDYDSDAEEEFETVS